ncbi:MAG TPA: long-chain fatty acid--CoA ligase [Polyangiaceae bacterium]|jgi:long-chain acyl-CoA synthetase
MSEPFRNLVDLCTRSCDAFAVSELFGTKQPSGVWRWITYAEFAKLVADFRGGLCKLGLGNGDRLAIIANNRVEWAVAAYAAYGVGATFVPMYEVQPLEEWKFILEDSEAKMVIGSTPAIVEQLRALKADLPGLERVIGLDLAASDPDSYAQVLELGAANPKSPEDPDPSQIAGFIYTSGTTGMPKGVVLTHGNFCANINSVQGLFDFGPTDRSLSFLPWAHSFGQTAELHILLSRGCAVAINDEVPNLVANLAVVKPTILLAVPRIFNRIYDGVHKQMQERPGVIQALFRAGIRAANKRSRGERPGALEGLGLVLAERLIFSKVVARFGGRLRFAISGSAALNKEVAEFVDALGIEVYEGYGLTEASPVVSVNYPGHRKIGSVGKAVPGVRVSIDTEVTADPKQGEIIVHGPNVMQGYYKREQETADVLLPDGGFRTGDMGYLDADGYLYITGRIKEQYKLETGKYVVPTPIEEELKLSPYVANAMLHGENHPYNVALIVVDLANLKLWAERERLELGDVETNSRVQELIMSEVEKHAARFKSFERPKRVAVISEDFTPESGLLTPSLKLKRREVLKKYGERVEALYG